MGYPSTAPTRVFCWFVGGVLLLFLFGGCGGGNTYSFDEGQVSQRFLPTERKVDYHPDSLDALTITEQDGKIQYELEQDYEALVRKWSSTFQTIGAGRSQRTSSYATLWSLELSLASLQPEMGILTLRKEKANELIEERKQEYFNTLQIDVYWFDGSWGDNGVLTGPSARTSLRIGEDSYRPQREENGPLREAFVGGGGTALYRRNTFYFDRVEEEKDLLEEASEVRLEIRRTGGGGSAQRFTWTWEDARGPTE